MVGPSWEQVLAGAGGVAERHILSAAGLSPLHRQRLVADGALVEVCVGTTALVAWPGVPTGPLGALRLAVTAAGPLAFAHRRSAAALWGLDGFCEGVDGQPPWAGPPAAPEVGIHRERSARGPGVHRVSGLRPGDVVLHLGIRTTAVARTLVDLGAVCPPDQVEWAVESALRSGLVDLSALLDPELVAGRWRGRVLAGVLRDRPDGAPATGSLAETLFSQLCRTSGLPSPRRQWEQVLGRRRLDFAWPAERVAVEVDGAATHGPAALAGDLRRQNRIVLAGWLLLRFTWDDIVGDPGGTVALVRAALGQGQIGDHGLDRG